VMPVHQVDDILSIWYEAHGTEDRPLRDAAINWDKLQ